MGVIAIRILGIADKQAVSTSDDRKIRESKVLEDSVMAVWDRDRLTEIFNESMEMCNERELGIKVASSIQAQRVIQEGDTIDCTGDKHDAPVKIVVSKKRTLEAAKGYKGRQVCIHNFASFKSPGGGVERGAVAQEECICRISTLFPCLTAPEAMEKFYQPHRKMNQPLGNDDCIYTPDVTVFKTDAAYPEELPVYDWYKVNVVTCAAPNLRSYKGRITQKELKGLHIKRIGRVLDIAKANGNDVVILGAFGCGVFQNQPEVVADACVTLIDQYRNDFEVIEFAVYCPPMDTRNYDVFHRRLKVFQNKGV